MTIRRLQASESSARPMRLLGAATMAPAEGDAKALRKFHMAAYNGGVYRFGWSPYPVVLDLSGIQISEKPRPILKDHDTAQVVGHSTTIVVLDGKSLEVDGVVSGTGPAAQEVVGNSDRGFPWQASIGADILSIEEIGAGVPVTVNGRNFTGPLTVVRTSTLGEVSFVALGNDDTTHAAMTAAKTNPPPVQGSIMDFNAWLKSLGLDPATLTPEAVAELQKAFDAVQAAEQATAAKDPAAPEKAQAARVATTKAIQAAAAKPAAPAASVVPAAIQAAREAAAADAERIAAIQISAKAHPQILAQAIREGWTKDATELAVLRAERATPPAINAGGSMTPVSSKVLQAAAMMAGRHAGIEKMFDERTLEAAAGRFRHGIGLQELILEAAWANGYQGRSFRQDMAGALRAAYGIQASGFSTVDLGGILSNVANKFVLEGYQGVEQVWKKIAAIRPVNDFKTVSSYRMTGNDQYEKVGPTGEIKHGTLTDQTFTNKADTYAKLLGISRTDMINDDLGAITGVPRKLGRGAGTKLNDVFWTEFLNNSAFFTSGNKNYATGTPGSLLTIDGLTAAELLFLDQTDTEGRPLGLMPKFLLVPTALSAQAAAIARSLEVRDTTANTKAPVNNPHAGKFEPIVSAYLGNTLYTGNSTKAWYLATDPADLASIEVAFLNGQEAPTVETADADFGTLGIQMRGYHDFGVAKQDFRGAVKMKGEA